MPTPDPVGRPGLPAGMLLTRRAFLASLAGSATALEARPKSLYLETRWDEIALTAPLGRQFGRVVANNRSRVGRQALCSSTSSH
jgi:hypothetical protein